MTPRPSELSRALSQPSRRTVVRTGIWSVPAIAVASAAPAYAASAEFTNDPVPPPGGVLELERCGQYESAALYFTISATRAISATAPEDRVTISLPPGLSFMGPAGPGETPSTRLVHPPATPANTSVTVRVPAFTVTGTAGAYFVTAAFHGILATQTVNVKIASGTFRQITRSQGSPTQTATFSLTPNNAAPSAVSGSISGDRTSGSAGVVGALITTTGALRHWGNLSGGATIPASQNFTWGSEQNAVNLGTATDLTIASAWTSVAIDSNPNHWGGAAARATTSSTAASNNGSSANTASGVFSWYRNGTGGTVRLARVGGLPNNAEVTYLAAHSGFSYVHAGASVYRWNSTGHPNSTSGNLAATVLPNTAGIQLVSTYGEFRVTDDDSLSNGGAGIVGRQLVTWATTSSSAPTVTARALPNGMGTPTKVVATMSGVVVLDSNNAIWTFNDNQNANAWFSPSIRAVDFSAWGYQTDQRYLGGTVITTAGTVVQFLVDSSPWHTSNVVLAGTSTPIEGIRRTESADGTYLALKWDGTLYGWNGNLDNAGRAPAATLSDSLSETLIGNTTVDIDVWGFHDSTASPATQYTGGGFLLTSVACPV